MGIIVLRFCGQPGSFSKGMQSFLPCGSILGLARRNRLLATQAERLSQAFAALEDIGTAIARTNDFEEVLGMVLEKTGTTYRRYRRRSFTL